MFEVPEDDAAVLRQIIGAKQDDTLPATLTNRYLCFKRCCDRVSAQITPNDLAMLAATCGYGKDLTEQEAKPPTIPELLAAGKIQLEARVEVDWRNAKVPGVLKSVTGKGDVVVQMDGDTSERTIAPDKVRPLTA